MLNPSIDIIASGHSVSSPPAPEGCSAIFAPCLDPQCERDCGARQIPIIEIVDAPVVSISERILIAAIIIFAILGGIAGHGAFDRQERAYQISERV